MIRPGDDRGVSVAVTHVLTIAITTILITGLLFSVSTLLDNQRERSAEQSMETTGERLASEIASVDRLGGSGNESINMTIDHPRRAGGFPYSIRTENGSCASSSIVNDTSCLVLSTNGGSAAVAVPVTVRNAEAIDGSATGGEIVIRYEEIGGNETIVIESDSR